ncbi:MAG: hypothetical protein E6G38_01920 [Actinobacteria bacterium]|nr:MAG: hypothetical protein E6G38_01920 [Actinomycetota bacterium]
MRDVALALAVLEGPDGADWYAMPLPPAARDDATLRVGWTHTAFGAVEDEIASAIEHAARALADSGAVVEPAEPAGFADVDANALTLQLYGVEAGAYFDELVGDRRSDLHPAMQQRLDLPRATLAEYVAAEAAVERLRRDLASFFRRYDVLLCPTAPVVAPPHDAEEIRIGGAAFAPRVSMRATIPFDLTVAASRGCRSRSSWSGGASRTRPCSARAPRSRLPRPRRPSVPAA